MRHGVVIQVSPEERHQGFYTHVFLVKKPSGSFHLVLNLKPLNRLVTYRRFRMDSIFTVRNRLIQGCFMESIDLRCVPSYSYSSPVSKVSEVGAENGGRASTSAIQSPYVWPFILSAEFHKSNGRSSRPTSSSGDCSNPIAGRSPLFLPHPGRDCKNICSEPAVLWKPWVGL